MGAHRKYKVVLTDDQKERLEKFIRAGRKSSRKITRARILLSCSEGRTYKQTAGALKVCQMTVFSTVKRFAESGPDLAPDGKSFPGKPPKIDGKVQATMTAAACSAPPDGHSSRTMQMIAGRLISLETVDSVSDETVRRYLKKAKSDRGRESSGASAN